MDNFYKYHWPQPAMIPALEEEVREFEKLFADDPRFLSAWGHAYFCAEDGAPLIFTMDNPFEHTCSICGKAYKGFILDGCHTTMVRNLAAVTTIKAAMLYRQTQQKEYLALVQKIIAFYARHYESFALHAKEHITADVTVDVGGAGKIMPQGLNESIFLIRMLTAMELVKDELDDTFLQTVKQDLFLPACELLRPQKMHIHNIPCWINSMLGMAGFFFGEKPLIEEALTNPFNINQQVEKGVTDAGFWYEGSIHYNFFALEGIMNLLIFCKRYQYSLPEKTTEKIKGMLFSAYSYAFDNSSFPNPSDGWPNVGLKTYSYVYYMGYAVFGEEILPLLKAIENSPLPRQRLPLSEPYYYKNNIPLERILYAPKEVENSPVPLPQKRQSASFESYNSAILRNDFYNVFFKYGHQTRSHSHPDKMNVEVMIQNQPFTQDLSNSGYTSRLCNEWHRRNIAHSTCMVNGIESDVEAPGQLIAYQPHEVKARVQAQPGVIFTRELCLRQELLQDTFEVECSDISTIDWFYHFEQPLCFTNAPENQANPLAEYPYLFECVAIPAEQQLCFTSGGHSVTLKIEPGTQCFMAKTYANPASRTRTTLLLRKKAATAVFSMAVQV